MAQYLCITRKSEGMGTQLAADSINLAKAGQLPTRLDCEPTRAAAQNWDLDMSRRAARQLG
jgi:hypothetical protein